MPRSYRYDHFKVPNGGHASPAELDTSDKQHLAESQAEEVKPPLEAVSDHGGIHYGHKFAETERLYQEKARAVQETAQKATPEVPATPGESVPGARWMDDLEAIYGDVTQRLTHSVGLFRHAVKDVRTATGELLHLPIDVAQLTWTRIGAR